MKKFLKCRNFLQVIASVIVSVLFVAASSYAATTISTNISTGGTLTVSGASTLSGNVTLGDAATDVNLFTGTLQASTTTLFTSGATMYNTLALYSASSAGTATEGGIYYDSGSKVIKLYDGSSWFTVGTTTSGLTLSGERLQLASLYHYMTFGTTTQTGFSMMTLQATSSVAIPLTIQGATSQTANLMQVHNDAATELFAIDSNGNASSTGTWSITGDVYFDGFATSSADSGNFSTVGTMTVAGNFIFNENGADKDFRVESSNQANMLFADGGTDRVGIASTTPNATLSVNALTGAEAFIVGSTTELFKIGSDQNITIGGTGDLIVDTDTLYVDNSADRVGISSSTPTDDLSIGTKNATSTIVMGKFCMYAEDSRGNGVWITIDVDSDDEIFATSTTPCN